ncbi:MAG: winged helix-turn-helix domain-containing protein [Burkholderiaceae bacterium]|nr:winged helix-turn-helix domain-containing protein [Burkholderiaceae bacterium]
MRLLLVEDDPMIGKAVQQGLTRAGFSVDWVTDGRAAELSIANDVYQAVILDLGLPRQDGLSVLSAARARHNPVPVLIATARDAVADRVGGLNAGADDYLIKPYDLEELIARVRALIRRHAGGATSLLECGDLRVDPIARTAELDGQPLELSAREFSLLEMLMQRPGAVLSREALEDSVYGWSSEVGSNAIEVHLHHLRKKLGADRIKNVRGVGYCVVEL